MVFADGVCRLEFIKTIKVIVGNDRIEFPVHKDILLKRSVFFRDDVSYNTKDTGMTKVFLLDTKPTTFEAYLHWAYSDNVAVATPGKKNAKLGDGEKIHRCFGLYVLAHQLKDVRMKVRLADMIEKAFDRHGNPPSLQTVELVYDKLPSESKLRLLILDKCGGRTHTACEHSQGCVYADWLLKQWDSLPLDFVKDLLRVRLGAGCGSRAGLRLEGQFHCQYHEHNEEMPHCPLLPLSHPECDQCNFDREL